jgi:hypothetical protein
MPAFFLKNNLEVLVWSLLIFGTVAVQDYRRLPFPSRPVFLQTFLALCMSLVDRVAQKINM